MTTSGIPHVRSVPTASGSVWVTVAVSQDEYTNTVSGVCIEDAASSKLLDDDIPF